MNMSYGQWQPNGGTDWGIRHNLNQMHKSEDARGTLIVTSAGNMGDFSHNDRINNGILKSKYKSTTLIVGALNTNDDNIVNTVIMREAPILPAEVTMRVPRASSDLCI